MPQLSLCGIVYLESSSQFHLLLLQRRLRYEADVCLRAFCLIEHIGDDAIRRLAVAAHKDTAVFAF